MRPNNQNNKNRSRNRNGGRKHVNPLSRSYESTGPDVKVRGNASHIAEKYLQLARDAQSSGDSVMAENYLQHAEHYFRIVMAAQQQSGQRSDQPGQDNDEFDDDMPEMNSRFSSPQQHVQQAVQGEADEPAEQRQPRQDNEDGQRPPRPDRPRRERLRPEGEVQLPVAAEPAQVAADEVAAEASTAEQPAAESEGAARKPRERRPRRRRTAAGEAGADPAQADQPDVGELPAFITAGGTANAAE